MKRLVLVGAGHAHALALKAFARTGVKDIEIVLVSPDVLAPYSGMIPGWLAGAYRWDACCIDFAHLCRRAGAKMHLDTVVALDTSRSELTLASGKRIYYDRLSLNIGSTVASPSGEGVFVLPMRPLSALNVRFEILLSHVCGLVGGADFQVVMVGGGAAGVESVLAVQRRLTQIAPEVNFSFKLAIQSQEILPGMALSAAHILRGKLKQRGVEIVNHFSADHVSSNTVVSTDGRVLSADAVLWATGAQAHSWPRNSGLRTDENGFVMIETTLRSLSHSNIFAAGDCAGWTPPLPKSGVYSVRMGSVLAHNLRAVTHDLPLRQYVPQRRTLALMGTGDGDAVAAWGPFSSHGSWIWCWKQHIDRRFVAHCNAY
jgi:pyridine nucleotide-disulfide oxidoreductase family protein